MKPLEVYFANHPHKAEPISGFFVRLWRDKRAEVSDPQDWLNPVLWSGECRHKVGGQVMPFTDIDDFTGFSTNELFELLRERSPKVVIMSIADGKILLPQMIMPTVPFYTADNELPVTIRDLCRDVLAQNMLVRLR